jgi:hypothetical protein
MELCFLRGPCLEVIRDKVRAQFSVLNGELAGNQDWRISRVFRGFYYWLGILIAE